MAYPITEPDRAMMTTALNLSGNIIPDVWLQRITQGKSGYPNWLAIWVLSDVCYWYSPTEVRDERTGAFIRHEKKYKGEYLQRSYADIMERTGCEKKQAQRACKLLKDFGLIKIHLRTVMVGNVKCANVMYIEPVIRRIHELTYAEVWTLVGGGVDSGVHTYGHEGGDGVDAGVQTNTSITTETSSEKKEKTASGKKTGDEASPSAVSFFDPSQSNAPNPRGVNADDGLSQSVPQGIGAGDAISAFESSLEADSIVGTNGHKKGQGGAVSAMGKNQSPPSSAYQRKAPASLDGFEAMWGNSAPAQIAQYLAQKLGGRASEYSEVAIDFRGIDDPMPTLERAIEVALFMRRACKPVSHKKLAADAVDYVLSGYTVEQAVAITAKDGRFRTENNLRDDPYPSLIKAWLVKNGVLPVSDSDEPQEITDVAIAFHAKYVQSGINAALMPDSVRAVFRALGIKSVAERMMLTPAQIQGGIDPHADYDLGQV